MTSPYARSRSMTGHTELSPLMGVMIGRRGPDHCTDRGGARVSIPDAITHGAADDGTDNSGSKVTMMTRLDVDTCAVVCRARVVVAMANRDMVAMAPAMTHGVIFRVVCPMLKLVVPSMVHSGMMLWFSAAVMPAIRSHRGRGGPGKDGYRNCADDQSVHGVLLSSVLILVWSVLHIRAG